MLEGQLRSGICQEPRDGRIWAPSRGAETLWEVSADGFAFPSEVGSEVVTRAEEGKRRSWEAC